MTETFTLQIDFSHYWCCGTGRGLGSALDLVAARDEIGLPIVPGRTIKGILRDAAKVLVAHSDFQNHDLEHLFGSEAFHHPENGEPTAQEKTSPGLLQFTSATIDKEVRAYLKSLEKEEERKAYAQTLFTHISQTALKPNGVAKPKSLRVIEAAVPLRLEAEISLLESSSIAQDFLEQAFVFVEGIGAYRSRGLGRCSLSFAEGTEATS